MSPFGPHSPTTTTPTDPSHPPDATGGADQRIQKRRSTSHDTVSDTHRWKGGLFDIERFIVIDSIHVNNTVQQAVCSVPD